MVKREKSNLSFSMMSFQRLVLTLELSALGKRETSFALRDQSSTESLPTLWHREEILPMEMELVEDLFMETNLRMRISKPNTQSQECCPWPMQDQILMDHSSLLLLPHVLGWMENMLSLDRLLKEFMLYMS